MGFLKGLGGAGAAGGGSNFLAKMFGIMSPEKMSSTINRIGMGANQIAQAGGAEAGYQPMQQPQMMPNPGMNNFLAEILNRRQQLPQQRPGMMPQNMSWYGVGNG